MICNGFELNKLKIRSFVLLKLVVDSYMDALLGLVLRLSFELCVCLLNKRQTRKDTSMYSDKDTAKCLLCKCVSMGTVRISLSVCLSACLSAWLCACLSVCLSVCISMAFLNQLHNPKSQEDVQHSKRTRKHKNSQRHSKYIENDFQTQDHLHDDCREAWRS